jgi:acyl-CoA thioester hydrolase
VTGPAVDSPTEYILSRRPFVVRRTVKWTECDPAGVVYTGRFVDYVASALHLFLGTLLGMPLQQAVLSVGVDFPLKALSFVFDASLRPDQMLDLAVAVAKLGNTTFETALTGRIVDGPQAFTARATTICVVPAERRAIRVPDGLRAKLREHATDQVQDRRASP